MPIQFQHLALKRKMFCGEHLLAVSYLVVDTCLTMKHTADMKLSSRRRHPKSLDLLTCMAETIDEPNLAIATNWSSCISANTPHLSLVGSKTHSSYSRAFRRRWHQQSCGRACERNEFIVPT
jgi:hypothetical protein